MVWLIALPFGQASPRSTVLLTVPPPGLYADDVRGGGESVALVETWQRLIQQCDSAIMCA